MRSELRAVALATLLLGWALAAPRLPERWNSLGQTMFASVVMLVSRASMGLSGPALRRGLRWGSAAAIPVLLVVAAGTAIPPVRNGMARRTLPAPAAPWLLLRIPFGTVWSEEVSYRGALGTAAQRAFGDAGGRMFTAAVFGASHVSDARAADESVSGTVFVTGVAGWGFSWLYAKSGSLAAPMLAHLAVNEAGAIAALAVQRRGDRGDGAAGRRRYGRVRPGRVVRSSGRRSRN